MQLTDQELTIIKLLTLGHTLTECAPRVKMERHSIGVYLNWARRRNRIKTNEQLMYEFAQAESADTIEIIPTNVRNQGMVKTYASFNEVSKRDFNASLDRTGVR